jgi:hypothetical protein
MDHFSMGEWADFIRQASVPQQRMLMEEHLESGCKGCLKTASIWKAVMNFALQEKENTPPAADVRVAASLYRALYSSRVEELSVAHLAFDSFLQAEIAGLRGASGSASRQLLYKCGTLCIDMRLEPQPGSNYVVLVGQLVDAHSPLKACEDISVSLMGDGDKLSETTTNTFGEFHFGFESVKHMQLFFGMERTGLVVPLPESSEEAA